MHILPEVERKNLRLKNYDYSLPGYYYITLCTQNRLCLFGNILNKKMTLNDSGNMILDVFNHLSNKFNTLFLDDFVIMPNHLHAIMILTDKVSAKQISLSDIVQYFKTYTTNCYIKGVKNINWQPFEKRLWQRSFYEHVIRNEESLINIKQYILDNPSKWDEDKENPNYIY